MKKTDSKIYLCSVTDSKYIAKMKIIMKLKKQEDVSSLSKLLSKLSVKPTSSPETFKKELLSVIKSDDIVKLLQLLKTSNHILNALPWDCELYFAVGKNVSPGSFDILHMISPFSQNIEKYFDNFFEGIAYGDNHALLVHVLKRISYKIIINKLTLFLDINAMRCFKLSFNFVCKMSTMEEFTKIMHCLLNRNIGTLNSDAIAIIQHTITKEKQS